MPEPLPEPVEELLSIAWAEAKHARAEAVEPVHLLIALCKQALPPVTRCLEIAGLDAVRLRRRVRAFAHAMAPRDGGGPTRVSGRVTHIMAEAKKSAEAGGRALLVVDVMLSLFEHPDGALQAVIEGEQLPVDRIKEGLRGEAARPEAVALQGHAGESGSVVEKYGKDYTQLAREGKLEPVIGRREELKQIIRVLLRKQKNNPVLIGEAGVGKTSVVEGLAQYAVSPGAASEIASMRIVEMPLAALVAGTKYRGDLEQRLQSLIHAAETDPNLVVFFDEIHMIVDAGGSSAMGTADILKPALARGAMRCIGATTPAEYARHIEKDPALERRFQPVRIEEPTPAETREILSGLRASYEEHHGVKITDEAIEAAVTLSVKYVPDRRLPDKARDLLDQAAVSARFKSLTPLAGTIGMLQPELTGEDIAAVVAEWTGIPVERLSLSDRDRLARLEETLQKRVIGQNHAVAAVARVVRTALSGLAPPNRPHGVFLFTGPTGVGKTELAKALAEFLFEDEHRMIRFDMSEYMEESSVNKLIGSPPGYIGHDEGGRLTDAVRRTPYSVVLFDEIEKAHPRIADLFLQIFDDGRLTDSHGRTADFRNTIIILTSNVTAENAKKQAPIGFERDPATGEFPPDIRAAFAGRFRPELLNRLSAIIPFNPLGPDHARAIVGKVIGNVKLRLREKRIDLNVTDAAYEALVRAGFDPRYGARELERIVEREVVQPLADGVVAGRWKEGTSVTVDAEGGGIRLRG